MSVIHRYSGAELTQDSPGALVTDATSDSGQVWQVTNAIDWGRRPAVAAGLTRLRFRLKRGAALGSVQLITDSGAGTSDLVTTSWDAITDVDLPEPGVWYTAERVVRYGAPGYWLALTGAWVGLLFDWVQVETLDEPVYLAGLLLDRLRYLPGEPGTVTALLVNTTSLPQTVSVQVTEESGLSRVQDGASVTLTLAAPTDADRGAGTDENAVVLALPHLEEYGHGIRVEVMQGGQVLTSAREYCLCSDTPQQVCQYYGYHFPGSYTDVDATNQLATMRRMYYGTAECYFWAPCDNSDLAPAEDIWRSGQVRRPMGKAPLQALIAAGHAQGLAFLAYVDRWGFGWRIFLHFARQHPDLVEWELGNAPTHSYDVAALETQAAADQGEDNTLPSSGMMPAAWGNPAAVAYHVDQLQQSMRMFGWDGFRYDHGSPVIDAVRDALGRPLPLADWTHAEVIAAIRDGIRAVNPRAIYGNNTGWNVVAKSLPYGDDPYTQQVQQGGLIMMEGDTDGQARAFGTCADEGTLYAEAGRNARRFGGQQLNIIDPNFTGPDHFFQAVMTLAGSCHIAYGVRDELRALMQLACRHCDLLYADDLQTAPAGAFRVAAAAPLLWEPFTRYRALSARKRQYVIHLLNVPAGLLGAGATTPAAVDQVQVTCVLPTGWTATAAHAITPDGGYSLTDLGLTQLGRGRYRVTVPHLIRYTAVVIEATGPAESAPRESLANARTAPRPVLTTPVGVLGADATLTYAIRGAEPVTRRVSEFSIAGSTPYPLPSGSTALRLGGTPLDLGFMPDIPRPGYYRLTVRAKSLVTPPAGAALSAVLESGTNGATPSASQVVNSAGWTAASFPVGQWVEATLDGALTYPNYWCALTGGWDGLVLDLIKIQRQRELTRAELAATVTDRWPTGQTVSTASTTAFIAAGLYYAESGLPAALQARGLTPALGKAARFRGALSLTPAFPSSADVLAGYRVVALANVEAGNLTPEQQLWLDHYVRGGGILVVSGGPYAFGNGSYADAPLTADLLPATCARGDLQPVNGLLAPVSALAQGVFWAAPPVVSWANAFTPKPGAIVELQVGSQPVAVSWALGSGRVLALGLAPLGTASSPYEGWDQWTTLLGKLVIGS